MPDRKYEDLVEEIENLLCRYRAKWQLSAIAWMDYDDVCQIIRLHIFNKLHLWNREKAFGPWCSTLISNQIKNLIRNHYGNFCKPCLRCPYYSGGDECGFTASGKQDVSCLDYAKWAKKKQKAYNLKLPLSLDLNIDGDKGIIGEVAYDKNVVILHEKVKEKLNERNKEIYSMLYIDFRPESEIAEKFGFKQDCNKRKTPRYKQISNLKKKFYKIAVDVMKEIDV
jgi:RNA polymerase sigma factor (sigma-70 family)